jgi:hypothetical protein
MSQRSPQFFTAKELAARQRKSLNALDLLNNRGQRPCFILGANIRFRLEDGEQGRRPA